MDAHPLGGSPNSFIFMHFLAKSKHNNPTINLMNCNPEENPGVATVSVTVISIRIRSKFKEANLFNFYEVVKIQLSNK